MQYYMQDDQGMPDYGQYGGGYPGDPYGYPPQEDLKFVPGYKRCNCKKAKCLKLYCVCFSAGVYCLNCACRDCMNTTENTRMVMEERQRILQRSPRAFAPKVEQKLTGDITHKKGCRCRKSRCLKKYCECYDAGVHCSNICRCEDCQNKPEVGGALLVGPGPMLAAPPPPMLAALGLPGGPGPVLTLDPAAAAALGAPGVPPPIPMLLPTSKASKAHGMTTRGLRGGGDLGAGSAAAAEAELQPVVKQEAGGLGSGLAEDQAAAGTPTAQAALSQLGGEQEEEDDHHLQDNHHNHHHLQLHVPDPNVAGTPDHEVAQMLMDELDAPSAGAPPSSLGPAGCRDHEDAFGTSSAGPHHSLAALAMSVGMPPLVPGCLDPTSEALMASPVCLSLASSPALHTASKADVRGRGSGAGAGIGEGGRNTGGRAVQTTSTAGDCSDQGGAMLATDLALAAVAACVTGAAGAGGADASAGAGAAGGAAKSTAGPPGKNNGMEPSPFHLVQAAASTAPAEQQQVQPTPAMNNAAAAPGVALLTDTSALLCPEVLLADPSMAQMLAQHLGLDATHQTAALKAAQILNSMLAMARTHPSFAAAAASLEHADPQAGGLRDALTGNVEYGPAATVLTTHTATTTMQPLPASTQHQQLAGGAAGLYKMGSGGLQQGGHAATPMHGGDATATITLRGPSGALQISKSGSLAPTLNHQGSGSLMQQQAQQQQQGAAMRLGSGSFRFPGAGRRASDSGCLGGLDPGSQPQLSAGGCWGAGGGHGTPCTDSGLHLADTLARGEFGAELSPNTLGLLRTQLSAGVGTSEAECEQPGSGMALSGLHAAATCGLHPFGSLQPVISTAEFNSQQQQQQALALQAAVQAVVAAAGTGGLGAGVDGRRGRGGRPAGSNHHNHHNNNHLLGYPLEMFSGGDVDSMGRAPKRQRCDAAEAAEVTSAMVIEGALASFLSGSPMPQFGGAPHTGGALSVGGGGGGLPEVCTGGSRGAVRRTPMGRGPSFNKGRAGQGHGGVGGGGGFTPIIDPSSQDEFEALQGLIEMGSRPTSHAGTPVSASRSGGHNHLNLPGLALSARMRGTASPVAPVPMMAMDIAEGTTGVGGLAVGVGVGDGATPRAQM